MQATGGSRPRAPTRETIKAGQVISAAAGWSTLVCAMAGVELPITTHTLQACVIESVDLAELAAAVSH